MKGSVRWFNASKGFGFINPDDKRDPVFVHFSSIISDKAEKILKAGDRVEFDIEERERGPMATKVKEI